MALTFNGNSPSTIIFNNQNVNKVLFNGVEVWPVAPSTSLYYKLDSRVLYLSTVNKTGYSDASNCLNAVGYNAVPWYNDTALAYDSIVIENNVRPNALESWFRGPSDVYESIGSSTYDVSNIDTSFCTAINSVFEDNHKFSTITGIDGWAVNNVQHISRVFNECIGLTSIDLSSWGTLNCTGFNYMFQNCRNITSIDLSNLNFTNTCDVSMLFAGCKSLQYLDISSLDTSKLTAFQQNFKDIFWGCSAVQTAYCRSASDKIFLDDLIAQNGYSWRFTVKS